MLSEIVIRKAQNSDIANMLKTFSVWHKTKQQFIKYLSMQENGNSVFVIALTDQNHVVGYANLLWHSRIKWHRDAYTPEIVDLNVITEHQRHGIATQIIKHVEKLVLANNIQNLGIAVEKTDEYIPAKKLYRKLGYLDEEKETIIDGEIVSVMSKELGILPEQNEFQGLKHKDALLWLLDTHCDTIYHKHWFQNKMNLSDETTYLPKEVASRITAIFGEIVSETTFPWQATLNKLQQGHVGAVVMNLGDLDLEASRVMLDSLDILIERHAPQLAICRNKTEIDTALYNKKISIIPAIEGMLMFHHDIELLRIWHARGVVFANLTHGEGTEGVTNFMRLILDENAEQHCQYALQITPSADCFMPSHERSRLRKIERGLNDFGRRALKEMEKLNMICDLSHANDAAFWEALELTRGRFCVTHSNCAALCPHTRNLTDEMMKALAEAGGVMGLCFFGEFIDSNPSLEKFVEHVLHALDNMGPDHVGIGSDYDGVGPDDFMAIAHPGLMKNLWMALEKAGVDKKTMAKIAHENFLRLLSN